MRQESRVTGAHTIYFNKTAIRDCYERTNVITICRAPDWNVVSYQPTTKHLYSQSLTKFAGYLQKEIAIFSGETFSDKPMIANGKSRLFSQETVTYVMPGEATKKARAQWHNGQAEGGEVAELSINALNDQSQSSSKEVNEVVRKMYGLPKIEGMPLTCDQVTNDLSKRKYLSTSILTKTTVAASEFEVPAGLTKVASLAEVVNTQDPSETSGFFDMVDYGGSARAKAGSSAARAGHR